MNKKGRKTAEKNVSTSFWVLPYITSTDPNIYREDLNIGVNTFLTNAQGAVNKGRRFALFECQGIRQRA